MESLKEGIPVERPEEGTISPSMSRRDSKRTWGPYAEPPSQNTAELSEEVQERLALTVIEHLKKSQ